MKNPFDVAGSLLSRAGEDDDFRERLLAKPKETIEEEFGVTMAEDHQIHVHEETYATTHLVLPPRSKFTGAEREEAKNGAASLDFLRKTMYAPAPPLRAPRFNRRKPQSPRRPPRSWQKRGEKASAVVSFSWNPR